MTCVTVGFCYPDMPSPIVVPLIAETISYSSARMELQAIVFDGQPSKAVYIGIIENMTASISGTSDAPITAVTLRGVGRAPAEGLLSEVRRLEEVWERGGSAYTIDSLMALRGPATYSVSGGRLPRGLELDPETGDIRGMIRDAGEFSFNVRMTTPNGYDETNYTGASPGVPGPVWIGDTPEGAPDGTLWIDTRAVWPGVATPPPAEPGPVWSPDDFGTTEPGQANTLPSRDIIFDEE